MNSNNSTGADPFDYAQFEADVARTSAPEPVTVAALAQQITEETTLRDLIETAFTTSVDVADLVGAACLVVAERGYGS